MEFWEWLCEARELLAEPTIATMMIRILLAGIAGALVGVEREVHGHAAGLRTHMLVCLGAALSAIIGVMLAEEMAELGINTDVQRTGAQVMSGVGFLGAGTILLKKANTRITGLTTAAGILATCGIGMAWGAGRYIIAIFATLLLMLLQFILHKILTGYDSTFNGEAVIIADASFDAEGLIHQVFDEYSVSIQKNRIKRLETGQLEFRLSFKTMHDISTQSIAKIMDEHPEFASIEL